MPYVRYVRKSGKKRKLVAAENNGIGGWTRRGKWRVKFEVTAKNVKWANYKEQGAAEAMNLVSTK